MTWKCKPWVGLYKITGTSMIPDYKEGDFVITMRIPFFNPRYSKGDIVIFNHAGYGTLIKNIDAILPDGSLFVKGSHFNSLDSRKLGPILKSDITGKVIWHVRKPE